jgi:hypothetical protein
VRLRSFTTLELPALGGDSGDVFVHMVRICVHSVSIEVAGQSSGTPSGAPQPV